MIVPAELEAVVQQTADDVHSALGGNDNGPNAQTCRVASEATWGVLYGICRSRVPMPVPWDLQAVALSLATRHAVVLDASDDTRSIRNGQADEQSGGNFKPGPWQSLTVSEWMIVNRYRRRSA